MIAPQISTSRTPQEGKHGPQRWHILKQAGSQEDAAFPVEGPGDTQGLGAGLFTACYGGALLF